MYTICLAPIYWSCGYEDTPEDELFPEQLTFNGKCDSVSSRQISLTSKGNFYPKFYNTILHQKNPTIIQSIDR